MCALVTGVQTCALPISEQLYFVGHHLVTGDYMLGPLWITLKEVFYGFILATVIGFTLGVLVGETAFGERAVMPYLVALVTRPKVEFAPLFIAWLERKMDVAGKCVSGRVVSGGGGHI